MSFVKSLPFLLFFLLPGHSLPPQAKLNTSHNFLRFTPRHQAPPCQGARQHANFPDSCSYALAHEDCQTGALIEYIHLYYCIASSDHGSHQLLKQVLCFLGLCLWLAALFYMLGNTAADYFCSCLERLSGILRLPPTVAGVTLLPLGNGAPDVFASVVSFSGGRGGEIGLNSVLGGALFVVTVVAGLVNVVVSRGGGDVRIDGYCFARDGSFFLFSLACLGIVLWRGWISGWEGLAYLGIYGLYAVVVVVWEIVRARLEAKRGDEESGEYQRLPSGEREAEVSERGLDRMITVPVWMWGPHLMIYSDQDENRSQNGERTEGLQDQPKAEIQSQLDGTQPGELTPDQSPKDKADTVLTPTTRAAQNQSPKEKSSSVQADNQSSDSAAADQTPHFHRESDDPSCNLHQHQQDEQQTEEPQREPKMTKTKSLLKLGRKASKLLIKGPLSLPRELTIPVVDESRWSRPRAIVSATLAPILLVSVWSAENSTPLSKDLGLLATGVAAGVVLGTIAFVTTVNERPPQCQVAWISAGFFMSVVWFYVIARELVAALLSVAAIMELDAGLLGLTVLAWGNSIGDVVANTAMATRGGGSSGTAGAQIAMAGCYGSPMFNVLIGLGVSMVVAGFRAEDGVYSLPGAEVAMVTVGFVAVAVVGAMGTLAVQGMRLSKGLGIGLIGWYGVFLVVRAGMTRWM